MDPQQVCVLHVAGDAAAEGFNGTVQALAQIGLHQVVLPLKGGVPRAAQPLEVRTPQWPSALLARIRVLEDELAVLSSERSFYAVHLHGARACLLGSRALRGSALKGGARLPSRVLFSPHLARFSSWTSVLVGRLLRAQLAPLHAGVLLASPGEAHVLSTLLERSAEVLPPVVDTVFFQMQRQDAVQPAVLAGGVGSEAVDGVSRLAVLLNGRGDRVPFAWLGAVTRAGRAQLEAAGVRVFDRENDAGAARLLSGAAAYLHLSQASGHLRAVAQAMAAGVPCLASDTLAHRAILRHGETGFVCAGDLDFVEKLILLLRNAAERERIGQAARAEAGRAFTQRHFDTAVLRAYGFHRVTLLPRKSVNVV
jgi:glycosyltransferase involved in cell wall biosynthesis